MTRPQRGQAASRGQRAERRAQATADELEEHQRVPGPVLMVVSPIVALQEHVPHAWRDRSAQRLHAGVVDKANRVIISFTPVRILADCVEASKS
jgi:hypothetical protein